MGYLISLIGWTTFILFLGLYGTQFKLWGKRKMISIKPDYGTLLYIKNKFTVIFALRKSIECVRGDCNTFT